MNIDTYITVEKYMTLHVSVISSLFTATLDFIHVQEIIKKLI